MNYLLDTSPPFISREWEYSYLIERHIATTPLLMAQAPHRRVSEGEVCECEREEGEAYFHQQRGLQFLADGAGAIPV